jgi:hypothetical protein
MVFILCCVLLLLFLLALFVPAVRVDPGEDGREGDSDMVLIILQTEQQSSFTMIYRREGKGSGGTRSTFASPLAST